MGRQEYKPLHGDSFRESFLMRVELVEWPNVYGFLVWSCNEQVCYRITTENVLEFHFMRTGTGRLEGIRDGIPLDDILVTYGSDFDYWSERISAFAEQGIDKGAPPLCIDFASHLFANRQRQLLTRDRSAGLLVVCRCVNIEIDHTYKGPTPTVYRIPSNEQ